MPAIRRKPTANGDEPRRENTAYAGETEGAVPRMVRRLMRTFRDCKAVLWTSGAIATGQILMMVNSLLTSRFLGPTGKGVVTALTTWAQLLTWMSVAGLGTAASVRLSALRSQDPSDMHNATRSVLGNTLVFCCLVGGAIAVAAALILPHLLGGLGTETGSLVIWAVAVIPFAIGGIVLMSVQVALGHQRIFNMAQISGPVVTLLLTVAFHLSGRLTPRLLIIAVISGSLASLVIASRALPWAALSLDLIALRGDLKFGLKLHVGSLLRLGSLRLDILVMSASISAAQIGLYGAANSAMFPVLILTSGSAALLTARVAAMSGLAAADQQAKVIRKEAVRYSAFSIAGGFVLALLAPTVVPLALGDAYVPSVRLIWILIPGYIGLGFTSIVAAGAAGMKRSWVGNLSESCALVVTVTLLPILLKRNGATGAAVTSTIACLSAALVAALVLKKLGRKPSRAPEKKGNHAAYEKLYSESPLSPEIISQTVVSSIVRRCGRDGPFVQSRRDHLYRQSINLERTKGLNLGY